MPNNRGYLGSRWSTENISWDVDKKLSKKRLRNRMETKIINDPIWGPIELHPLCIRIIDTPQFQRLRSIKQLGGCSFVYPGACHTRFEHSIGTSYLAKRLGRELQKKIGAEQSNELEITDEEILCLEVAGLCHDLGHGPFSHLFDLQFFKKAKPGETWEHEDASIKMIQGIFEIIQQDYVNDEEIKFIKDLVKIIANDLNKIDVDKWDYFSRDCHMLGLHHNFQCERSIKVARLVKHNGKYHISFPKSARLEYFNLFDMFYTRFTLHRRAYQHSVTKAVEMMIADAFLNADERLMFPPNQTEQWCLSETVKDMRAYLWVTDDTLNQIRTLNPDGNDKIKKAQEIVDRIYRRDFYKVIGEKRVKWRDESKSLPKNCLQKWMEEKLTTEKDLFEIQSFKILPKAVKALP
uniref:SAM domain and HD domain-containing protein 1 n=1 Tax=Magallana gigas TaxID=29159 RepID=K1PVT3_MAGGI